MISKKKIIAIVSFILMGFIMFTFANPGDGIDPMTEPIKKEEKPATPVKKDETNPVVGAPLVAVDQAPVITIDKKIVKVVEGTEYDVKQGVTVTDDKDTNLEIKSSIAVITEKDAAGTYEVTYTVVDSANNTTTAKRTIIILAPDEDEDNDGYTNIEESQNDSDFDNEEEMPEDNAPVITIDKDVTIEYATDFDLMNGVTIDDDFDSLENKKLIVETDIKDTKELTVGLHVVNYTVTDRKGNVTTITRTITVEDTTAPTLKLNGKANITIEAGVGTYTEENATATDAVDGTWTVEPVSISYKETGKSAVKVDAVDTTKVGKYTVKFTCTDKSGNICRNITGENKYVARVVLVQDTKSPAIKLNGEKELTLEAGVDTYTELNATATDVLDGTWTVEPTSISYKETATDAVKVDAVDTTKVGKYTIKYTCTDKVGNACINEANNNKYILRTVNVVDTIVPVITGIENNKYYNEKVSFSVEDNTKLTVKVDGVETTNYVVTKDGKHTVEVKDEAGNTATVVFTIDTKKPVVTVKTGATETIGSTVNKIYSKVSFKLHDNLLIDKYFLNGVLVQDASDNAWGDANFFTIKTIGAKEGKNVFTLVDVAGNSTDYEFTFDTKKPEVTVKTGATETIGSTVNKIYSKVSFKLHDNLLIDKYFLNGVLVQDASDNAWGDANGLTVKTIGAKEGKNVFTLVDVAGNSTDYEFTFDTKKPVVTVKTGATETVGNISNKIYSMVSLKLSDNTLIDKYYLNGVLVQDASNNKWGDANFFTVKTIGATEGKNVFTLVDVAGNSTDYEFTFDATKPKITVKDESIVVEGLEDTYTNVSFKLFDANKVTKIVVNGNVKELTPNSYSDLNEVSVGNMFGVVGANTVVLYDMAGNTTTYNFTLKKLLTKEVLKDVVFEDQVYNYNGKQHNLVATNLPSWVKVEYVNNAKVNIQEAIVTAKITAKLDSNYTGTVKLTAKLTIKDLEAPLMEINGEAHQTLRMGIDKYEELGVLVTDNVEEPISSLKPIAINYYVNPKDTSKQQIVSKVDTDVIGRYRVLYIYKDKAKNQGLDKNNIKNNFISRIVDVIDVTAPVITGIEDGSNYVNAVSYEVADKYLTNIVVDGVSYTKENAPYTITEEGTHTVEATDSSNNSTKITFNIERKYNVKVVDYNGDVLAEDLVKAGKSAEALIPNMIGKTYTKTDVTYTFSGWDKDYSAINSETVVTALYEITEVKASLFELNEYVERPVNGATATNWQQVYKKIGTTKITIDENVKNITLKNNTKILSYDITNVTSYIIDASSLPLPSDSKENFKKYEFYVIKHENDGWHIDAQSVVDESAKNAYRDSAIASIKKHATDLGFDSNITEILEIISTSNISNLNTKTEIDTAVVNAKSAIDALLLTTKESAKAEVIAANTGFKELYQPNANEIVNNALTNIDNAETVPSIVGLKDNAINELNNLKSLMNQTFAVSLINNKNNVLVNNIASDIKLVNAEYIYTLYETEKFDIDSHKSSLVLEYKLDRWYKDVNYVKISYTKNGKSFTALYEVEYEGFIIKKPAGIKLISNSYKA